MSTSAANHPEFESEQAYLRHAYECLAAMRGRLAAQGNAGGDKKAAAALEKMRRRGLERLDDPHSVCFGRLDLEQGDGFYVGPQLIWGDKDDVVVTSWAADAAKPYYEAGPEDPQGLKRRRRFRTQRELLLGISDDVFGTEPEGEPTIADILLDELGRERTAEMRQIAATIQRDQYRIISRPLESTTVVQGGPGTGKTAVGLHRAALLLYRHRKELASARVLVVGPNPLFMQYIAYVLPSLGETAVDQLAVDELGVVNASKSDDRIVARVKGDERMAEVLRRAVRDRVRVPTEDLRFKANGVDFSVGAHAIDELVKDFDPAQQTYVVARSRFRVELERRVGAAYSAESQRRRPGTAPTPLSIRSLPEFDRALDRIWPAITAAELVRQLLASEERLERATEGVLSDTERRLLHRKPVERLDQVEWSTSDVPLVDEVQPLIERTPQRAGHVVLDEAQDLTPMQLRMVGRRIRDGSVTVLGDLAQATGLWSYASWDAITAHLGVAATAEVEELTLAYRVPREIMEIALPVLNLTAPSIRPPEAFRDGGEDPGFIELARGDRVRHAVDRAEAAHGGGGTAAIVAPTSLLDELRDELERRHIEFGDAARGELAASIELLDAISAKGLEFDHVVLIEPAAIIREAAEGQGHRELYVALTRAMRTLVCLHCEPLPWPLGRSDLPQPGVEPVSEKSPEVGPPAGSTTPAEEVGTPSISVGEALVLARLRGIDLEHALARALLASTAGVGESEAAAAVLTSDFGEAVDELLKQARALASDGGE